MIFSAPSFKGVPSTYHFNGKKERRQYTYVDKFLLEKGIQLKKLIIGAGIIFLNKNNSQYETIYKF
jgi:hypothetical protein